MATRKESFNRLSKSQWVQLSLARDSASLRQASDLGGVSQLTVFSAVCLVQRFGFLSHRCLVDGSSHTLVLDIVSSLSHLVRQRIHIRASVSRDRSDNLTFRRRILVRFQDMQAAIPTIMCERKQAKAFTVGIRLRADRVSDEVVLPSSSQHGYLWVYRVFHHRFAECDGKT